MQKSKATQILASFTKDEIKRFGDFLNSPYFNTNTRVTKLFNELKKYYPEFSSKMVEKESLYKKLFPGKQYNEQVMKNLISELLSLEKEFISIDGYTYDPFRKSLGLLTQLVRKPLNSIFSKEASDIEELLKSGSAPSDMVHYYLHMLEERRFTHNVVNNKQSVASENIEMSGEYLTLFFLKTILRLSINAHINKFSFNLDIEKNFPDILLERIDMENLLKYMEGMNIEHMLSLKLMYYAMICIHNVDDEESFKKYHDLLYENIGNIKKDEIILYFHFMESICAQKINSGRREFYKELFKTYELEIANNVYNPDENSVTVMKYRNIYLCAIRVGEYDWAEKFIKDFEGKLQEDNRQSIVELALAQLSFEKKNYEKTLEHLNKIKTEQIFFKVDTKSLNLMAFYELGHYESAISLIDSFRKMLSGNKSLTSQYREKNINFVNAVSAMIKLKLEKDNDAADSLAEKIKNLNSGQKNWLILKAAELKG